MFARLDAAILACCTKFSHALQRATGLTCYFIAKVGVFLAASSLIVDIGNHYLNFLVNKTPTWVVFMFSIMLGSMFFRSLWLSRAEESLGDVKPRQLMPYVTIRGGWRLLYVVLAIFDMTGFVFYYRLFHYPLLEWFDKAFFIGTMLFYYFVAVDPLPPGRSKVRQWLAKFSAALKLAPSGA